MKESLSMRKLKKGDEITSPQTKNRYRIKALLGEGGFGCAYRASAKIGLRRSAKEVCLKMTDDQASWHRESYFGELMKRNKRVIEMYDSFVLTPKTPRGKLNYCTVFELAENGDLLSYLERTKKGWTVKRIKREVDALLQMLDQLHGGSATHRDITPMNIFVCGNGVLKLGDFGIAQHELSSFLRTVDAYNPWFIPPRFFERSHPHWEPVDDTYQMGHVIAMLVSGQAEEKITLRSVDKLNCNKELRAIIKRAIGPRKQRFVDAYEMLQALKGRRDPVKISLCSLKNKKVVFTGKLSITHFDTQILVLQAGGTIRKKMSPNVDVLVLGKRSPLFKKGHKGCKLLEAEKLIKEGRKIHIIGEREFRRLVRKKSIRAKR